MSPDDTPRAQPLRVALPSWSVRVGLVPAALVLTLLSSSFERLGPELAQYGNLCGVSQSDPCTKPRLNGGLPLPYLFDAPDVSVEGKLSFGEDEFRAAPFVVDMAVYIAAVLLATGALSRSRSVGRSTAGA